MSTRPCPECGGEGCREVSQPQRDDPYYAVVSQCRHCGGVGRVEEDGPPVDLGILDDMDHEAKWDTDAEYRKSELRIQALGAAISRRDWHATEKAYEAIRDKFYWHGAALSAGKTSQNSGET